MTTPTPTPKAQKRGSTWKDEETEVLIKAWKVALDQPSEQGESGAIFNQRIFDQFKVVGVDVGTRCEYH
jgi:hypothetical protein